MKPVQKLKSDYARVEAMKRSPDFAMNLCAFIDQKNDCKNRLRVLLAAAGPEFGSVIKTLDSLEECCLAIGNPGMDFEAYGDEVSTILGCILLNIQKTINWSEADALEALLWMEQNTVEE